MRKWACLKMLAIHTLNFIPVQVVVPVHMVLNLLQSNIHPGHFLMVFFLINNFFLCSYVTLRHLDNTTIHNNLRHLQHLRHFCC
jgi:heme A synthase